MSRPFWRGSVGAARCAASTKFRGASGFAVGADDLGGPLRDLCDSRAHPHPPRMRSAPSPYKVEGFRAGLGPAPTADMGAATLFSQGPVPDRPARIRAGSVGSANPGAPTGPHQPKFLQTQGPVARLEFRPATQILRAGNPIPGQKDNPRNGGSRGRAAWRREALPNRRLRPPPGAFLVTFWASKKSLAPQGETL